MSTTTTTTTPAPLTVKLTKGAAIGLLTTIAAIITTYIKANPAWTVDGAIIGFALGDAITFLQGSTLSDKWTYASVNLLLSAVLATAGTFVGQLVSGSIVAPMVGALIGYGIAYAITLLDAGPAGMATPSPSPVETPPAASTA